MTRGNTALAERQAQGYQIGTVDQAKVAQFMAPVAQASKAQLQTVADRIYADIKRGYNPTKDHTLSSATFAAVLDALDALIAK